MLEVHKLVKLASQNLSLGYKTICYLMWYVFMMMYSVHNAGDIHFICLVFTMMPTTRCMEPNCIDTVRVPTPPSDNIRLNTSTKVIIRVNSTLYLINVIGYFFILTYDTLYLRILFFRFFVSFLLYFCC